MNQSIKDMDAGTLRLVVTRQVDVIDRLLRDNEILRRRPALDASAISMPREAAQQLATLLEAGFLSSSKSCRALRALLDDGDGMSSPADSIGPEQQADEMAGLWSAIERVRAVAAELPVGIDSEGGSHD